MPRQRLKPKDLVFVKEYIKSNNGTKSAKKAYGLKTDKVAQVTASKKLSKDMIQKKIQDYFDDGEIAFKIHEGLNATRTSMTPEGKVMVSKDFANRHKYIDTVSKIKGWYQDNVRLLGSDEEPLKIILEHKKPTIDGEVIDSIDSDSLVN